MREFRLPQRGIGIAFAFFLYLMSSTLFAQKLERVDTSKEEFQGTKVLNKYHLLANFKQIPSESQIKSLQNQGVELISYRQNNQYLIAVPTNTDLEFLLQKNRITALRPVSLEEKLAPELLAQNPLDKSRFAENPLRVVLIFHKKITSQFIENFVKENQLYTTTFLRDGNMLFAEIERRNIATLASNPAISYIDLQQEADVPLLKDARAGMGVEVVGAKFPGGDNLRGQGVCVGVGDGGELGNHIDFKGRVINYAAGTYSSYGGHGDLVSGIVAGAGNLNPDMRGIAGECTLITQKTSSITANAVTYYADHNMVITNNSYGSSFSCTTAGSYNYSSQYLDNQIRSYPEMIHVFAAGNSGHLDCPPYLTGYKTLLRAYQAAKNVITVGNAQKDRTVFYQSSKGPASDGRIKPEVVTIAQLVYSTGRDYDYWEFGGTSASAPAASASLALMYQQYKKLNGGANPKSALMKAILCNASDDIGNVGPDYSSGFGLVNVRRSVETIKAGNYAMGTVAHGGQKTHTLNVPAGARQVKVMLYWHDMEQTVFTGKALINDLDVKLVTPSNQTILPWVLNHNSTNVNDLPQRAIDTLNNIEQITFDVPAQGSYQIVVNGKKITSGTQEYAITYEILMPNIVLTSPIGEEAISPATATTVRWDADDDNSAPFTLEYSLDGGTNWILIDNNVVATARLYTWTTPNVLADDVFVRVSRNGILGKNILPCHILSTPINLRATQVCDGSLHLEWDALGYATEYEVYKLGTNFMEVIANTPQTNYDVTGLTTGQEYWFAVRAKTTNGKFSRRCNAIRATSSDAANCIWQNDVRLMQVNFARKVGRVGTSTAFTANETMTAEIKNVGLNTMSNIPILLTKNAELMQDVCNTNIPSGQSQIHTFSSSLNLSAPNTYSFDVWLKHPDDAHPTGDSLRNIVIRQLPNEAISLPHLTNFNSMQDAHYVTSNLGINELDRMDYSNTGQGEFGVVTDSTGAALDKCLQITPVLANNTHTNEVIFTYNLSNISSKNIVMKFDYRYFENGDVTSDQLWIRGSDTDAWLPLFQLNNQLNWTTTPYLFVSTLLNSNSQLQTSSFQLKFVQQSDLEYLLDNITLYDAEVVLPVELISFNAQKRDDDVLLTWITATEINNDYFEVEMANSNELGERNFQSIGRMKGQGTSSAKKTYHFVDTERFKSGVRYYRLKQVDFDGKAEYSPVVSVHFEETAQGNLNAFPNPFDEDRFFLHFNEEKAGDLTIQVYNSIGFLLQNIETPLSVGNTIVPVTLPTSTPSGIYWVKCRIGKRVFERKIVKQD